MKLARGETITTNMELTALARMQESALRKVTVRKAVSSCDGEERNHDDNGDN